MDPPFLAHTATRLADASGRVAVCGAHSGRHSAQLALAAGVRAVLFNDAGIGRDRAGIAGLALCAEEGVAAAALDHRSCRIGDAADALARGIVSHANAIALAQGVEPGQSAREAAARLAAAPLPAGAPPAVAPMLRWVEERRGGRVVVVDSAALVRPVEDDGAVIVTGSHGALAGGDPAVAGRATARLFAFNDAGVGCENAGVSRLSALQMRRVPSVCVDCHSARIGDGMSTLRDGVISHHNAAAAALGARRGLPLAEFVTRLVGTHPDVG